MATPAVATVIPMRESPLQEMELLRATMGCDPEVFVTSGREVLPAYKFLPDKKNAIVFKNLGDWQSCSSIFWDGVQAEMTVPEDACIARLVDSVHDGLRRIKAAAVQYAPDARLTFLNTVPFPEKERMTAAKEHVELGCSPSKNVYGDFGRFVRDGRKLPVRFAGGHVTVGTRTAIEQREKVVKALDAVLGVWSVGAAASIDDPVRREFYGLAGEYRAPSFGIEYRTLSNFWLCHPGIMSLVFEIARAVVSGVHYGLLPHGWQATEREICDTINTCNVAQARAILARNRRLFNCLIDHANFSGAARARAIEVGLQGIESVVPNFKDIEANWRLDGRWLYHASSKGCQWGTLADPKATAR